MMLRNLLVSFTALCLAGQAAAPGAPGNIDLESDADGLSVRVDGKLFTRYVTSSRFDKKPYFWPVMGPKSGISITTESSEPYPHHNSIWFGCDKLNGADYWHHQVASGKIISQGSRIVDSGGLKAVFEDVCLWQPTEGNPVLRDYRRVTVSAPDPCTRLIDVVITMLPLTDITIQKTNHSLFAIRVSPDLSVKNGGVMRNAEGAEGENATFGKKAEWMSLSGNRDGVTEGIALVQHPSNPWHPSPWFTRDYGFISPTPMYWLKGGHLKLKKGEALTLAYRIIAHEGDAEEARVAEWAKAYSASTPRPSVAWQEDRLERHLRAMQKHKEGQSRRDLLALEQIVRDASNDTDQATAISRRLLDALEHPEASYALKSFVLGQLALVGGAESVAPLARLLYREDEHLAVLAVTTLSSIPDPSASRALQASLNKVDGRILLTIITSLGDRGDPDSIKPLSRLAESENKESAQLAVAALGRIGGPEAVDVLYALWKKNPRDKERFIADALVRAAGSLTNDPSRSVEIYNKVFAETLSTGSRMAAVSAALATAPEDGEKLLSLALQSNSAALRQGAMSLAIETDSKGVTRLLIDQLRTAGTGEQIGLLNLLQERGDRSAADAVRELLASGDAAIQPAAIHALGLLGDADDVERLVSRLPDKDAAEALARLKGAGVTETLAEALGRASPAMSVTLVEILGQRGDPAAGGALWAAATGGDDKLRKAALKGLASVGTVRELESMMRALSEEMDSETARKAFEGGLAALSLHLAGSESASRFALDGFDSATETGKASLIRVMGKLQEEQALDTLVKSAQSRNATVQEAAIRALANWPNESAIQPLLDIARKTDQLTMNVLALRGVNRLLKASGRPLAELKPLYDSGKAAARREEERNALNIQGAWIKDLEVKSKRAYRVVQGGLDTGARWTTDRDYTFLEVPAMVKGATYIQTAMDDKQSRDAEFITFTVDTPVEVFVAYDSRCTQLPAWLAEWPKTGDRITPPPTTHCTLPLYRKSFDAGRVTLGGNAAAGTAAMYIVAVKELNNQPKTD